MYYRIKGGDFMLVITRYTRISEYGLLRGVRGVMCEIRGVETRTPVCAVCEKYGPRNASGVLRGQRRDRAEGTQATGVL